MDGVERRAARVAGSARLTRTSHGNAELASDRLGVPAVVFFVMSGIAPLTVAAGVVTTAYAVTGLTAIPAAFIVTAVVLGLFSVGYVAMARHVTNAAALYAFVTRGLGRLAGYGAALVALVAYNLLQVGLYGAFGPAAAGYAADKLDLHAPWWVWALGAWALVAMLGLLRVDIKGWVLGVLVTTEVLVVVGLAVSGLRHPAGGRLSFATLAPSELVGSGVGAAVVIAVLGYVGFEGAAVLAEEARHRRRTVPVATYVSLGLIAVVYAGASWAMAAHYGDDRVAGLAQAQGPATLFALGGHLLSEAAQILYLTSLFAAMLAFHTVVSRYLFGLGRDAVLPAMLARTGRNGSPWLASLGQSCLGVAVIVLYAVAGWDPMVHLFFWLGTTGGFGVLLLLAVTSLAAVAFFARTPTTESWWHRAGAPGLASAILAVMIWLAVRNYATLLGVLPGSPASRWLPALYLVTALAGACWALSGPRHRRERA
ncbi:MAG TPA: APC family permease [Mycobacteriales bacterium]|nr:APC family permease [Mycobacteriales bacterium]